MGRQDVRLTREKINPQEDRVRIVDSKFQADRDSKTYKQFRKWAIRSGLDVVEIEHTMGKRQGKKSPDFRLVHSQTQQSFIVEIKDLQLSAVLDKEDTVYRTDSDHRKVLGKLLKADKQLVESSKEGLPTIVILGRRFGELYDLNKVFGILGWIPVISALHGEHKFQAISAVGGFVDTNDPNNRERLYLIRNPHATVELARALPGTILNNQVCGHTTDE